jgi:hypothetical protein
LQTIFLKNYRSFPERAAKIQTFFKLPNFYSENLKLFSPDLSPKPLKEHPLFVKRDANIERNFFLANVF